jgi:hypothetical protein
MFMFYLQWHRPSVFRVAIKASIFLAIFVFSFGYLGDIRALDYSIQNSLGQDSDSGLPSGVFWIFAYLASPVANLTHNIVNTHPDFSMIPVNLFGPMFPSIVRKAFGADTSFYGYLGELAHPAFNVGTAFIAAFIDGGVFYVGLFSAAIGFVGHAAWSKARQFPSFLPLLSFFQTCVVLTVFSNQFFQIMIVVVFILLVYGVRVQAQPAIHRLNVRLSRGGTIS